MASSSQSRHRSGRGVRYTMNEIIELLFHTRRLSTSTRVSRVSRTDIRRGARTGVTLRPNRVHIVHGTSTGARGHAAKHIFPHLFARRYTRTRFALTLSDTPGVRACMVREDFRIERAAAGAQTLAVSDGVTRARIIMRMTRAVTGVHRPLDIVSRARFVPSG